MQHGEVYCVHSLVMRSDSDSSRNVPLVTWLTSPATPTSCGLRELRTRTCKQAGGMRDEGGLEHRVTCMQAGGMREG